MIYLGSYEVESIMVTEADENGKSTWVDLVQEVDMPSFRVEYGECENWYWKFWYSKAAYETVKYYIMNCIAKSETIDELLDLLDDTFEEHCRDFVFDDDECDNDVCDCEECEKNND